MTTIAESRFFSTLLERYPRSPSIALCRVPELELLSEINVEAPVLDHCCGDGFIVSQAFPGRELEAGVDLDQSRLSHARSSGVYAQAAYADAAQRLPFPDRSFSTIINNSGIEHIADLDAALCEIARVLKPGGRVFLNVLNSRYFEWWPGSTRDAVRYRAWQPFYHALDEDEWTTVLHGAGFGDVVFVDYFQRDVARLLAELDFRYSGVFLRKHFDLRTLAELVMPVSRLRRRWRRLFGPLEWQAPEGEGAGFRIEAVRQ